MDIFPGKDHPTLAHELDFTITQTQSLKKNLFVLLGFPLTLYPGELLSQIFKIDTAIAIPLAALQVILLVKESWVSKGAILILGLTALIAIFAIALNIHFGKAPPASRSKFFEGSTKAWLVFRTVYYLAFTVYFTWLISGFHSKTSALQNDSYKNLSARTDRKLYIDENQNRPTGGYQVEILIKSL
jgi:hypothetical protein